MHVNYACRIEVTLCSPATMASKKPSVDAEPLLQAIEILHRPDTSPVKLAAVNDWLQNFEHSADAWRVSNTAAPLHGSLVHMVVLVLKRQPCCQSSNYEHVQSAYARSTRICSIHDCNIPQLQHEQVHHQNRPHRSSLWSIKLHLAGLQRSFAKPLTAIPSIVICGAHAAQQDPKADAILAC